MSVADLSITVQQRIVDNILTKVSIDSVDDTDLEGNSADTVNLDYKATFEKSISAASSLNAKFSLVLDIPKSLNISQAEKLILAEITKNIFDMKGSKKIKSIIEDSLDSAFLTGKVDSYKSSAQVEGSIRKQKRSALRDNLGRFTSAIKLQNLLNNQLHDQLKDNMWDSSAPSTGVLRYQTGRFANSAKVTSIVRTREDTLNIFYSYLKRPYAVFARGGKLHTPDRDVDTLISNSIRDIAYHLINKRFRVIITPGG